ncbi:MAG: hypothetical protein Q8N51_20240 [Gammaproteobacteria bacterium]|nr:hypothetical protein [Gammaproteobacteria bacterium]
MRDDLILLIHLVVTIARLFTPGGARTIVAESATTTEAAVGVMASD